MSEHRYTDILARCLQLEDKAQRDAVLAELPAKQAEIVRRMMSGLGRRLARYVARGEDREMRWIRLNTIKEPWLRERVERMVRERFERKGAA